MKLISCHIENFGRLRGYDYVFADGLNTFFHENGWGKSTFAAFLCAMFYGLPASRKKQAAENVRERYRPWQGGVYGGSLLFEAGGNLYEISRTYGKKESSDTFELRDPETNLPSFDFSSRIGEELFRLDRESFLRTVFTKQQDCETRGTDDINALIADLAQQAGDMGSCEDAMRRLSEAANRLAPGRKTGSLYRRAEEIRVLEREAAGAEEMEESIFACGERLREEEEREKKLAEELARTEMELESARRIAEERARAAEADRVSAEKQAVLRRLRETEQLRRDGALAAAEEFPGRVPAKEEVEQALRECRRLERLEYRMQENMLSEEEQNRLTELEEEFAEMPADYLRDPLSDSPRFDLQKSASPRSSSPRSASPRSSSPRSDSPRSASPQFNSPGESFSKILLFAGLLLIAAGAAAGILVRSAVVVGLAAAAGVLCIAAALWRLHIYDRRQFSDEERDEERSSSSARRFPSREEEYLRLLEKEKNLEEIHARWAEARRPVTAFLRGLGFSPEEDLRSQLERIRDAADACEDAQALLREAETERRRLEAECAELEKTRQKPAGAEGVGLNDAKADLTEPRRQADISKRPAAAQIGTAEIPQLLRQADAVRALLLQCRNTIEDQRTEMEELQAELEEQEAAAARLEILCAEQETETEMYTGITEAASLLRKAKESLTARYADPVRRSFGENWERITATSAAGVHVDANMSVTIEELGKQREISLASAGYRDLAGISLRIALADAMYPAGRGERPPLILDDPFASLDDEKIQGALRLLREASERYQILYFTCSRSRI